MRNSQDPNMARDELIRKDDQPLQTFHLWYWLKEPLESPFLGEIEKMYILEQDEDGTTIEWVEGGDAALPTDEMNAISAAKEQKREAEMMEAGAIKDALKMGRESCKGHSSWGDESKPLTFDRFVRLIIGVSTMGERDLLMVIILFSQKPPLICNSGRLPEA
jgi:hypothetical protein